MLSFITEVATGAIIMAFMLGLSLAAIKVIHELSVLVGSSW